MSGLGSGLPAADGPRVLRTAAEPASLSRIRRFVEDAAIDLGADPTVVPDVIQAVDESVTNIIEHGYRDAPGIVEVEVRVTPGTLVVQLRDQRAAVRPDQRAAP